MKYFTGLFLCMLLLPLGACCFFSSSNHIQVIDAGNVNGKRSYYMGSSARHHHFWVGRVHGRPGSGYEHRVPRERYRMTVVRPYSPYYHEWSSYQSTYIRPVVKISGKGPWRVKEVGVSAGYRNTKIRRWSQPIPPHIIKED